MAGRTLSAVLLLILFTITWLPSTYTLHIPEQGYRELASFEKILELTPRDRFSINLTPSETASGLAWSIEGEELVNWTVVLPPEALEAAALLPDWLRQPFLKALWNATRARLLFIVAAAAAYGDYPMPWPALADLNGDDKLDLAISAPNGTGYWRVIWCANLGTDTRPFFVYKGNRSFEVFVVEGPMAAAFADVNRDRRIDVVLGFINGSVAFFKNVGTPYQPAWRAEPSVTAGISVGGIAVPALCDLNGDGYPDLVVGGSGELRSYVYNASSRKFEEATGLLPEVELAGQVSPALCQVSSLEGDITYLYLGLENATLVAYARCEGDAWERVYVETIPAEGPVAPAVGDIDRDARPELFLGARVYDEWLAYMFDWEYGPHFGCVTFSENFGSPRVPQYFFRRSGREVTLWDDWINSMYPTIPWDDPYPVDLPPFVVSNVTWDYVQELANIVLETYSQNRSWVDEVAYVIANGYWNWLAQLVYYNCTDLLIENARSIYDTAAKLPYVRISELGEYTTLEYLARNGSWCTMPKDIYYKHVVMLNPELLLPYYWPDEYGGYFYRDFFLSDTTYSDVTLLDCLSNATSLYNASWWALRWLKYHVGAYYHHGANRGRTWYQIWIHLLDSNWAVHCGEFGWIFHAILRAGLIPSRDVLEMGEDHVWNEFWAEGRWVHVDASAFGGAGGGEATWRGWWNYFDNPRIYDQVGPTHIPSDKCWYSRLYDGAVNRSVITAPISIDEKPAELVFQHKYDLRGATGFVEVTTDYGLSWETVAAFSGESKGWRNETIDLGSFVGNTIRIRFRLQSGTDSFGYGWWIDNIRVIVAGNTVFNFTNCADSDYMIAEPPFHAWFSPFYQDNTSWSLESPSIDVSGCSQVTIEFLTRYSFEAEKTMGLIEYSFDGGNTWTSIATLEGSQATWVLKTYTVPVSGTKLRIRFCFKAEENATYGFWWVENVKVLSEGGALLFYDWVEPLTEGNWTVAPEGTWSISLYGTRQGWYCGGWGKCVSTVFPQELDGIWDGMPACTERYTEAFRLIIRVLDANGKPVESAEVEAWSHWLCDWQYNWPVPWFSYYTFTGPDGEAVMELGGGNYTILVLSPVGGKEVLNYTWLEEWQEYVFEVRMPYALPDIKRPAAGTGAAQNPYYLKIEVVVEEAWMSVNDYIIRAPYYSHLLHVNDTTGVDVYVLTEDEYLRYVQGLDSIAIYAYENVSTLDVVEYAPNQPIYVVISNEEAQATYRKVRVRVAIYEDVEAPSVTITYPQNGTIVGTSNVTVRYSSEDPDVEGYEVKVDEGGWISVGMNTSFTLIGLEEGWHNVTVRVYDQTGYSSNATVCFYVDLSYPRLVIRRIEVVHEDGSIGVIVYGSATDPNIKGVWVKNATLLGGALPGEMGLAPPENFSWRIWTSREGGFNYTAVVEAQDVVNHTVQITLSIVLSNQSIEWWFAASEEAYTVADDVCPPNLKLQWHLENRTLVLEGSISDFEGSAVSIRINGTEVEVQNGSFTYYSAFDNRTELTLVIEASDSYGHGAHIMLPVTAPPLEVKPPEKAPEKGGVPLLAVVGAVVGAVAAGLAFFFLYYRKRRLGESGQERAS